ncbi:hypothetical protein [Clostridium perfringens]|uniref:hypothetical protein n=1 Tax=Clostridium perfringens TaxID=1502 RepID=UPI0024BBF68A|nr:hypothetical protein [Clostridium perfringens]
MINLYTINDLELVLNDGFSKVIKNIFKDEIRNIEEVKSKNYKELFIISKIVTESGKILKSNKIKINN